MQEPLFDLSDLEKHAKLFASSELPWEWLVRLDAYLRGFESRIPVGAVESGAHLREDLGPIHIEDGATVQFGAVIRGPAYIGRGSIIGYNAFVSGVLILENCVVGHCSQVKGSIFLPGSKAPHLNYVGDSILGRGVNLGAGVKTGNLPLDSKPGQSIKVVWDEQSVETGLKKLGALIGDGTQIGCNCVTNPGTVIGKNCRAYGQATLGGTYGPARRIRPDVAMKETEQILGDLTAK